MAPYDSDSDEEEDREFTETNVLLGYANKEANGEVVSRLGGRPEWLEHDKPPSAALARCKVCKDLMVLLLQLNGELPDRFPGHERRLYVFACRRKTCRRKEGSIRAVRGVRVSSQAAAAAQARDEEKAAVVAAAQAEKKPAGPGLGDALFGAKSFGSGSGSSNPFGGASTLGGNPFSKPSGGSTNPFSKPTPASEGTSKTDAAPVPEADPAKDLPKTFAETLNLNNPQQQPVAAGPPPPPEPWPAEDAQPPAYPVLWIADAEYETLDPTPMPSVPTTTTAMDIDDPSSGGKEDKEVFESSMDSTFQKFADRIGENPDQVIRYEFAGQPLLYNKGDPVGKALGAAAAASGSDGGVRVGKGGMPRCQACGAGRLFEVQLAPNAIAELEADEDGLEGMDWGTIIVGVCEKDCQARGVGEGEAGYLEEWAGIQWEELSARR